MAAYGENRDAAWTVAAWTSEVGALITSAVLLVLGNATIHDHTPAPHVAVIALVVVATTVGLAIAGRTVAPRLAPLLLTLLLPGLIRASSPSVTVIGFALGALVPAAVVRAVRAAPPRAFTGAAIVAALACTVARATLRNPARELRCQPACDENPLLIERMPDVVARSERIAAFALLAFVVASVWRRMRVRARMAEVAADLAVMTVATTWAIHLLVEPRPLPNVDGDRRAFVAMLLGLVAAAAARGVGAAHVAATRVRIGRFARSIVAAANVDSITSALRSATGDHSVTVDLGDHRERGAAAAGMARTAVVRGDRVVATIHHRSSSHDQVATAVTPEVALAIETQLVLSEASEQLARLERSRFAAVEAADDARRRLERDLHDGAQQRLLVVGMRVAGAADRRSAGAADRGSDENAYLLRRAAASVRAALTELRRIGRGAAAIVAELGLDDAVTSLVGSAPVPATSTVERCDDRGHDCWPTSTATTAYLLLMGSVATAQRSAATWLAFEVRCLGEAAGRSVITRHDGAPVPERSGDHDRVHAAGGRVVAEQSGADNAFEVWLP